MSDGGSEVVKVSIQAKVDRDKMTAILADNGYKVWIEEKELQHFEKEQFVCFERYSG